MAKKTPKEKKRRKEKLKKRQAARGAKQVSTPQPSKPLKK